MTYASLTKPTAKKPAAKRPAAPKTTPKPFASVDAIKLGMIARDPATGFVGKLIMKAELISGTVQYALQPESADGKAMPEGRFIDDLMLEYVGEGVAARVPAPDANARFRLGEELEDKISGFKGIAIERTIYLNGCVHYTLQTRKPPRWQFWRQNDNLNDRFDYKRLRKLSNGIVEPAPKPKPVKAARTEPQPMPKPVEPATFQRSPVGGPMRSTQGY